jgi:hypothetical protein
MKIEFFDAHSHWIEKQTGGFLIAIEGDQPISKTYNNEEVLTLKKSNDKFIPVQYIRKSFQETETPVVKYHPRREGYSPNQIISDIKRRKPRIVIIDTLNQPYWCPRDYWEIAKKFPSIQFLFAHAGGYDVFDFAKICDFQQNSWLDFSFTQHYFGWCGSRPQMNVILEIIHYCFENDRIRNKILFGSDNMFCSQQESLEKYLVLSDVQKYLTDNFNNLVLMGLQ